MDKTSRCGRGDRGSIPRGGVIYLGLNLLHKPNAGMLIGVTLLRRFELNS